MAVSLWHIEISNPMGIPRVDQFTTLVQQEAHARFIGPQIALGAAHYHVSLHVGRLPLTK